jgi:hypothetical protein
MRHVIVAALVVGFVLRLGFAFGYWVGKPLTLDEQEYLLLGSSIARGDGFKYPGAQAARHFERPPAFAALVAAALVVSPGRSGPTARWASGRADDLPRSSSEVPAAIKITQVLLGVLGIGLVAAIAGQVAGRAAAGIAAGLAAIYPPLVWICGYVLAEPLYSVLALAVVWLLQRASRPARHRYALLVAAGLVAGTAVLAKEAMIFFLPLAAAWLVRQRRLAPALVFSLGVGIVLAPWVAHNYAVYGRFVLTAPHGGVTFWTGNNALSPGEGDLAANPEMGRARVAFEARHAGESTEALDRAYYQEAFGFIAGHPVQWLSLVARKLFYTFAPIGPSYRLHSTLYFGTSLVSYAILFALGLAGLRTLAAGRGLSGGWALWLLAASTVIMSLVFFPQERFRIPVVDPTLVIAAAAWMEARPGVRHLFADDFRAEDRD